VITAVPGIRVGHWTGAATGVTVVLAPAGTIGSGEVRGGAPASRETALLEPARLVERVDAVVLSGGSAFGLAAADGAMRFLAERGQGFPTRGGPVPIVVGACIFDLVGADGERPGAEEGYAACVDAERGQPGPGHGRVGAGRGATVGTWRGPEFGVPGGFGTAVRTDGGLVVGALAVVNAAGDVVSADGRVLAGSTAPPDVGPFGRTEGAGGGAGAGATPSNTTLVVVATNAALDRPACFLLAQSAHHGLAVSLRPSHTRFDGDLAVSLATGEVADVPVDLVRLLAVDAVAAAVRSAVDPSEPTR
jgi:L-aminopeptidase/D-esterase-like protein